MESGDGEGGLMGEKLWTVEELAAYWRIKKETIYRLIRERRISFTPVGRFYRIPDSQVKAGYETKVDSSGVK